MKLNIIDDEGFIAIVNNDSYQSFVDEDWQFDQLTAHFVSQMNAGNIAIWQTCNDGGGNWLLSFQEHPSATTAFRQFEQNVNVTSGALFLTNYSDLTLAAQFLDERIPARHHADLKIELENGWYKLTVRQMFDPDDYEQEFDEEHISFEVIIMPSAQPLLSPVKNVYWRDH
ncbi:hypothetical protein [Mucilaginibacter psychrotolerans]|uniref:Uncharacterized protein n=1 Tax=Mucilaginibacter psychrotolerans TaxID=1524096 RepID=A0A4Y8S9S6_9SPHI|nr:hypothetical protein [Mucilaginibacter psychrotolerans]TFF35421.1 hypothetical protein E2R66_19390 [Mucilaginibacter psychrotolerans]